VYNGLFAAAAGSAPGAAIFFSTYETVKEVSLRCVLCCVCVLKVSRGCALGCAAGASKLPRALPKRTIDR